jgi:hypothetical protein
VPGAARIEVQGIRELNRAFADISKEVKTQMRKELAEAAEPARAQAEALAAGHIRNITPAWSRMRLGLVVRGVYLAPAARRRGGSPRPNLGGLLLERSMLPAVEEARPEIFARLETWLDGISIANGF